MILWIREAESMNYSSVILTGYFMAPSLQFPPSVATLARLKVTSEALLGTSLPRVLTHTHSLLNIFHCWLSSYPGNRPLWLSTKVKGNQVILEKHPLSQALKSKKVQENFIYLFKRYSLGWVCFSLLKKDLSSSPWLAWYSLDRQTRQAWNSQRGPPTSDSQCCD